MTAPGAPVAPDGPCLPMGPEGPSGPAGPATTAPGAPIAPVGPCAPMGPEGPSGPGGPTKPMGCALLQPTANREITANINKRFIVLPSVNGELPCAAGSLPSGYDLVISSLSTLSRDDLTVITVIRAGELIAIVRATPQRGGGPPPNAPKRAHALAPWNLRSRRVTVSALTVPSASASEAEQRTTPG